jgi:hypothetical protein
MKFLLHKDIKEIANAQMAHLVLHDTQANASQNLLLNNFVALHLIFNINAQYINTSLKWA